MRPVNTVRIIFAQIGLGLITGIGSGGQAIRLAEINTRGKAEADRNLNVREEIFTTLADPFSDSYIRTNALRRVKR